MHYQYTAKSSAGQTESGVIHAESPAAARKQLRDKSLFVMRLDAMKAGGVSIAKAAAAAPKRASRRSGVPKRDLLMLTSQLAIMGKAGIDLAESIRNASVQCVNVRLKVVLEAVYSDVSSGEAVSVALRKHPQVFSEFYVAGIAAGEASGSVVEALSRLGDLLRNEIRLRSSIAAALSYPVILMSVSFLVVAALIFFVLPQFAQVFQQLEVPAPALTQFLLDVGCEVRTRSWLWGPLIAATLFGLIRGWSTQLGRSLRDKLMLHAPGLRDVSRSLLLGRTFRLMGTMLLNGVPLLEAIRLCRSSIGNLQYRDLFDRLEASVLSGSGIGQTLVATSFIPPGAAQMAVTAEKTGKLGPIMEVVGQFYEDDGERRLLELTKLLEPAIIVAMGAIVGGIVLAIMLPIFEFSTQSK